MSDSTQDAPYDAIEEPNEHASLRDLVSIRDGETPVVSKHVNDCVFCQARLEEVHSTAKSLQEALLFEAELPVPSAVWAKLEARLETQLEKRQLEKWSGNTSSAGVRNFGNDVDDIAAADAFGGHQAHAGQHAGGLSAYSAAKPSFWTSVNTAIYSLTAAVMFTGLVSLYTFHGQEDSRIESRALQASIQSLMDNSRGLESVLQQVAAQNNAFTSSDQSVVERLQWRLMLVDQKIHESESSDDASYEQIKALWAARIDALTELNQLYYTNQVAVTSGEF